MKYTIEFEIPDNETMLEIMKWDKVTWSICGYGGRAKPKPKEEIIHCKDCRFWKNQGTSIGWLPCMEVQTGGKWFCGSGKK